MLCSSCHFIPLKLLTLRMHHAKLFDVLTSLPESHAKLPRIVCFATSHSANHAICSYIDSSGYASRPIRKCLFIDYMFYMDLFMILVFGDGCWHPDSILTLTVFQSRQFFTLARPYIKYMLYSLQIFRHISCMVSVLTI